LSDRRPRWHRPLDPEDLALWEAVKRSAKPLRPEPPRPSGPPKLAVVRAEPLAPPPVPRPLNEAPKVHPDPPRDTLPAIDRPIRRKVGRGVEPIACRLDLHGLRQEEAHRALLGFLREARARGDRIVLVITGKGVNDAQGERGVLRRAVPRWLRLPEFRGLVAGVSEAHLGHGGAGALYVHVKRRRGGEP
jgi:DNA-nicking Smr family endonuclease